MIRDVLVSYLKMCEKMGGDEFVCTKAVRVYAAALARDGFAIKPGLQPDPRLNRIVGLESDTLWDVDYVRSNPSVDAAWLKTHIVKEANQYLLTLLTGKLALPIGAFYRSDSSKDENTVANEVHDSVVNLSSCLECSSTADLGDGCILTESTCTTTACRGRSLSIISNMIANSWQIVRRLLFVVHARTWVIHALNRR